MVEPTTRSGVTEAAHVAAQMLAHLDECNRLGKFSSIGEEHIRQIATGLIEATAAPVMADARDLFEIMRPSFHYAKRGTGDGGLFERSETGRLLMNACKVVMSARVSSAPALRDGEERAATAYLHVMHLEHGQTQERLSMHDANPFGKPGQDYSEGYAVTCTPLFAATPMQGGGE
jgi:hypothetical protein